MTFKLIVQNITVKFKVVNFIVKVVKVIKVIIKVIKIMAMKAI